MSPIDELAAQLYGADATKTIAAENPYTPIEAIPDSITNLLTSLAAKPGNNYSLGSLLGASAISGLTGGLLKGLGDDYNVTKQGEYQTALNNFRLGQSNDGTDLSPTLLKSAENNANKFKLLSQLNDEQAQKEAALKVSAQKSLLTDPEIIQAEIDKNTKIKALTEGGKKVSDEDIANAFPNLSAGQVKSANGNINLAATINTGNIKEDKPVDKSAIQELQNLDNARNRLNTVLPSIAKFEALAKDRPGITLAEIEGSKLLPFSDIAAIKSELPSLLLDLQGIKPSGGARPPPLTEFHAVSEAIAGTAPLAQGLTLDRIMGLYNDRADAVKGSFDKAYNFGQTKNHATHLLESYGDALAPVNRETFSSTTAPTNPTVPTILPGETREQFIARVTGQ